VAADKPEQMAKRQADEAIQATIDGKFSKLADLTYPKVIEMIGGKEKMIARLQTNYKDMKEQGFVFQSAKVQEPSALVAAGETVYTVVPFTLEMKVTGGLLSTKSYLLGISSNKGKSWTFVDGSGISNDEKTTRKLLPGLPAALKLPKKEPPIFHEDKPSKKK
jgi:hypothetical protein